MQTLTGSFNTGRKYSPEGQIINWTCEISNELGTSDGWPYYELYILFSDTTRDISGSIQTTTLGVITVHSIQSILLTNYDAGNY